MEECGNGEILHAKLAIGINMWLYCGEGCWGGWTSTRAATLMSLFDLEERNTMPKSASGRTTLPLDLDAPMSYIKCFSGCLVRRIPEDL